MNNTVILNKDYSTWPTIKKYWESKSVDIDLQAIPNGWSGWYYGFIGGKFGCYLICEVQDANAEIIELPEEPKEEKKYPEKPILRLAYEIIGRLKAENLKRAGFNDIEISTYLDADKDLKEIESHLNK